jgi:hypothetical protein
MLLQPASDFIIHLYEDGTRRFTTIDRVLRSAGLSG